MKLSVVIFLVWGTSLGPQQTKRPPTKYTLMRYVVYKSCAPKTCFIVTIHSRMISIWRQKNKTSHLLGYMLDILLCVPPLAFYNIASTIQCDIVLRITPLFFDKNCPSTTFGRWFPVQKLQFKQHIPKKTKAQDIAQQKS